MDCPLPDITMFKQCFIVMSNYVDTHTLGDVHEYCCCIVVVFASWRIYALGSW